MKKNLSDDSRFKGLRIAITGANGSLGKQLIEVLKRKGAYVVGLTHERKKIVTVLKAIRMNGFFGPAEKKNSFQAVLLILTF